MEIFFSNFASWQTPNQRCIWHIPKAKPPLNLSWWYEYYTWKAISTANHQLSALGRSSCGADLASAVFRGAVGGAESGSWSKRMQLRTYAVPSEILSILPAVHCCGEQCRWSVLYMINQANWTQASLNHLVSRVDSVIQINKMQHFQSKYVWKPYGDSTVQKLPISY